MFTKEEKIQMVTCCNSGYSLRNVCGMFANLYPDSPRPNPSTISRIFSKFKSDVCVDTTHKKRIRIKTARNEENRNTLLHAIVNSSFDIDSLSFILILNYDKFT